MRNNRLDDIIKCNIDLSSPVSNDATFDSICIIVPGPEAEGTIAITKAFAISKADELLDYGFTTDDVAYIAATVAFSQNPCPDSIYVSVRKPTSEEGIEPVEYEDIALALSRANDESGAYGYHITGFKDPADVQGAISWIEANEKMFAFEYTDIDACPVKNTNFFRSFGFYSGQADGYEDGEVPAENEYAALAHMACCFGYQPGSETWAYKTLATIVPSWLSTQQKKDLEAAYINTYRRYSGANVTFGGYVLAGEWIDVIRFRDWLKAEIQTNTFNALKTNTKVPYTDGGIGLIESAMEEAMAEGTEVGGIAPTEYDGNDNAIPGYTIIVPTASNLTEAERKSRKLSGCKWSARLAGAIHLVEINGNLTF